ncbi:hypothetical protein HYW83_02040 [Candidatus Peregrinibacteria bacterium]|nr:hypothetical protein [Candidatus Peregrinibacteria bacterium]
MKNKNNYRFHYISGAILFLVMFGIATFVSALAPGPGIPESSIKNCVAKIFEYDREEVFADVPVQQWYTHAANFLILLDPSFGAEGGENDEPTLPKFHPDEKITRGDFLNMIDKYRPMFTKKLPALRSQKPKAKLKQTEIAVILSHALKIPKKDIIEEFRKNNLKNKWVLRKEAAYVLFKSVEKVLFQMPEKILCDKQAMEDPEGFEEIFGANNTPGDSGKCIEFEPMPGYKTCLMNTPPDDLPVDIESPPATPEIPPAPQAPDTNFTSINFAPENPRAGETIKATVSLVNAQKEPMSGVNDLYLVLAAGRDFEKRYDLKEFEAGKYAVDISSEWAGTYSVGVYQNTAPVGSPLDLVFQPNDPAEIKLISVIPQEKSASKKEAQISATLRDKFGNTIDADAREFRITTDIGTVKKTEKSGAETLITIEADKWGEANLTVSHLNRSAVQDATGKLKIPFKPFVFDVPKGLEPSKSISIPAYVFLPKDKGKIAGYRLTLNYEKSDLVFQNATDLDPNDGFDAPKVTLGDGTLKLEQTTREAPVEGVVAIGSLNFTTTAAIGSGTVYVPTGVVINDQEKIINLDPSSGWGEDFFRWWYDVKAVKDVCLDVWLTEGAAATRTQAMDDINEASNVFNLAAARSFCPFWINWTINFHSISAADWTAKIDVGTGTPNRLDPGEQTNLKNNFSGSAQCVQIWYVPEIAPRAGKNILGLSYPNNGGVAINNRRDRDNLTLGHELAHQLSGNAVKDPPHDAGGAQGSHDHGNVMSYDHTGRNMTKTQCELVKQKPYIP